MGYDCTLHVVDPVFIDGAYTDALLGQEGQRLWDAGNVGEVLSEVKRLVSSAEPRAAASAVAQGALVASSALLPYHSERQFALSLWDEQPDGLDARVPKRFLGDPASLFPRLLEAKPALRSHFAREFTGNFSTGFYVPAAKVPELLKWVESRVKRYRKPDRRLFRGLMLILQEAATRGLAYWEGTDLPVEMNVVRLPRTEEDKDVLEFKLPEGLWEVIGRSGSHLVLGHALRARCLVDVGTWPPRAEVFDRYWMGFDEVRPGGPIVAVEHAGDYEYMNGRERSSSAVYEVRVYEGLWGGSWRTMPMEGISAPLGAWSVGVMGGRVVAEPTYHFGRLERKVLFLEDDSGVLRRTAVLPSAEDSRNGAGEQYENAEDVGFRVVHLEGGSDVLLWGYGGYELEGNALRKTFDLTPLQSSPSGHHGREFGNHFTSVRFGADGFYFISQRRVSLACRGGPIEQFLPRITNAMAVAEGGNGSLLVREGTNSGGRLGVLWYPKEGVYYPIDPEVLVPDEDPDEVGSLFVDVAGARVLFVTTSRIWSSPLSRILNGPAYNADTGRKRRQ